MGKIDHIKIKKVLCDFSIVFLPFLIHLLTFFPPSLSGFLFPSLPYSLSLCLLA